jgi:hypothetical protein
MQFFYPILSQNIRFIGIETQDVMGVFTHFVGKSEKMVLINDLNNYIGVK